VRLRFGKWKCTQLFYLEQVAEEHPNLYRFRCEEDKSTYMFYDNYLKVEKINPFDSKCHWEIKPCYENEVINRSCYIENAYSTLAVDVPAGSLKEG
jgi:hypothetical protein